MNLTNLTKQKKCKKHL